MKLQFDTQAEALPRVLERGIGNYLGIVEMGDTPFRRQRFRVRRNSGLAADTDEVSDTRFTPD